MSVVPRFRPSPRRATGIARLALLLAVALAAHSVPALVRFDFEQKYFVHPGHQVWDFTLIRPDSLYHLYYHAIPDATPTAASGDTIWHATSPDLEHWDIAGPVVTVSPSGFEEGAVWAPDVFRDEDNQRWVMAYTACDSNLNQRLALAFSSDLFVWSQSADNPVLEPDSLAYIWDPAGSWSDFRDPYVWRQDGLWNVLLTAKKWYTTGTGVVYHATSPDLLDWTDQGPLFVNNGTEPGRVLESSQYRVIGSTHHLFCGLFDDSGISLLSAADPSLWSIADTVRIEDGSYAPELTEFAPGQYLFGRISPLVLPQTSDLAYVARFDTLAVGPAGENLSVAMPHPLDARWASHTGLTFNANPTFGDNPVYRGEPSVGLVGNGYFSSKEYYQGPLSGRGAPGISLGDVLQGSMDSRPFIITGDRIDLLVGGGDYPETCYVALMAATDSTILFKATGNGDERLTPRTWDVRALVGTECFIRIVDSADGAMGHINVDEIVESRDTTSAARPQGPDGPVTRLRVGPNPGNPRTVVSFDLDRPATVRLRILDLRGRAVWTGAPRNGVPGTNRIPWDGRDARGVRAASGTYLYFLEADGCVAATGKLSLVK